MEIIGTIGGFLLLGKIILHIFYKYSTDNDFHLGSPQNPQRFILFLPAFKEDFVQHKKLRIILNAIYWISILFISIFLISQTIKK